MNVCFMVVIICRSFSARHQVRYENVFHTTVTSRTNINPQTSISKIFIFTVLVNNSYLNFLKTKTESLSTLAGNRVRSRSVEKAVLEVEHETVN